MLLPYLCCDRKSNIFNCIYPLLIPVFNCNDSCCSDCMYNASAYLQPEVGIVHDMSQQNIMNNHHEKGDSSLFMCRKQLW